MLLELRSSSSETARNTLNLYLKMKGTSHCHSHTVSMKTFTLGTVQLSTQNAHKTPSWSMSFYHFKTVTIWYRFPVISYKKVRSDSEHQTVGEIASTQPSFVERREKRRVVIYEQEQNKAKINECERELPASKASPVMQTHQGWTTETTGKDRQPYFGTGTSVKKKR